MDAWINDPPSESEDETVPTNPYEYTKQSIFSEGQQENYYHGSNLSSNAGDNSPKHYTELTSEELERHRETRKQSEHLNPFYIKETKKSKSTVQVRVAYMNDVFVLIFNL